MQSDKDLLMDQAQIKAAQPLREKSIDDAVALEKGLSRRDMKYHILWKDGGYEVGVGKPGKEAERAENTNINDMWPYVKKDELIFEKSATFDDIFYELEKLKDEKDSSLYLLGCLFIRSAKMLDHQIEHERVVYKPPASALEKISNEIPTLLDFPIEVFLQYLDAIALNEDVKYQRRLNKSGKPYGKDAGRPNNLLTCAHLIAVLLGRASVVSFATGFTKKRGVSPIEARQIEQIFPQLGYIAPPKRARREKKS